MTYTPAPFTNSNFAGEKINQPQTYMQYDMAALQYHVRRQLQHQ